MNFLEELNSLLDGFGLPHALGAFPDKAGDMFIVVSPMDEYGTLFADNAPEIEISEARIGLYVRNADYEPYKNRLKKALKQADFTITSSKYVEFEKSTGYHHYNFDVLKYYNESEE